MSSAVGGTVGTFLRGILARSAESLSQGPLLNSWSSRIWNLNMGMETTDKRSEGSERNPHNEPCLAEVSRMNRRELASLNLALPPN